MNDETIMIRVSSQLKQDLQIIAIKKKTNMAEIIRPMLEKYVEQHKK